jgi:hypothetical protein
MSLAFGNSFVDRHVATAAVNAADVYADSRLDYATALCATHLHCPSIVASRLEMLGREQRSG